MALEEQARFIFSAIAVVVFAIFLLYVVWLCAREPLEKIKSGQGRLKACLCLLAGYMVYRVLTASNDYLYASSLMLLFLCSAAYIIMVAWKMIKICCSAREFDSKHWLQFCEEAIQTPAAVWKYDSLDIESINPGELFEFYIKDLFTALGFTYARVTEKKTSTNPDGDHGADIVAELAFKRCVIQCKHNAESNAVGVDVIRDLVAARYYYCASCAIVVTTSTFTKPAIRYAKTMRVLLIDGDELRRIASGEGFDLYRKAELQPRSHLNPFTNMNKYVHSCPRFNETVRNDTRSSF